MRQEQRLGQLFRKEYIDSLQLLGQSYDHEEVEVYSTGFNRTMQSVQSILFGLYPNGTGPRLTLVDREWHLPPFSNKSDVQEQNYAFPGSFQPIPVKQNPRVMLQDCPNANA
jgi:hypothetical protein